jgi:type III secretion protein J
MTAMRDTRKNSSCGFMTKMALVVAMVAALSSCKESLIGELKVSDARAIETLLIEHGIKSDVTAGKDGTYSLSISSDDLDKAKMLLAEAGLPRQSYKTIEDLFPGDGLVVTPFEQQARLTYATEQQLSATLATLDGVASANVNLVLARDNGRGVIQERARASAVVMYREGRDPVEISVNARAVLVNSVRGLAEEDVAIVMTPVRSPTQATAAAAMLSAASRVAAPSESPTGILIPIAIVLVLLAGYLMFAPIRKTADGKTS